MRDPRLMHAFQATAVLVAVALVDLVARGSLDSRTDAMLAAFGALPVVVFAVAALLPTPR